MALLRTRVAERLARLPGRRAPVKGWSLVADWLYCHSGRKGLDVVYETAYGVRLHLDLNDRYTQRVMFYDAYEVQELNFVAAVLRPGDVVFDIGANVGLFTLVAAKAAGSSGSVHSFEPVPGNWERLSENVELNGFTNVKLNHSAVRDRPGTVALAINAEMARTSGANTSGFFTASGVLDPVKEVTARAETIDDYVSRNLANQRIRLIKIDVEGSEPSVLAGMHRVLHSLQVDFLMVEINLYGLARGGSRILDVVEPVRAAGYELFRYGLGGLLRPWSYRAEPSIPDRATGRDGLLAGVYKGIQDLNRLFNLVAIRGDHPAVAGRRRFISADRLRRTA